MMMLDDRTQFEIRDLCRTIARVVHEVGQELVPLLEKANKIAERHVPRPQESFGPIRRRPTMNQSQAQGDFDETPF